MVLMMIVDLMKSDILVEQKSLEVDELKAIEDYDDYDYYFQYRPCFVVLNSNYVREDH